MFFIQHNYFAGTLIFLLLWIFVFILNNKIDRINIIKISLITMALGLFVQPMHLVDLWNPNFVFNSFIKIEDVIFGFSLGGFISGIYTILSKKRGQTAFVTFQNIYKIPLLLVFFFSLFGLFYLFQVSSFWSCIIALSVPAIFLLLWRIKALPAVFLAAFIVGLVSVFGYMGLNHFLPSYTNDTYMISNLSGQLFMGVPLEILCWFFFAGLGISSFQELFFSS
jgi:hypothetical protein